MLLLKVREYSVLTIDHNSAVERIIMYLMECYTKRGMECEVKTTIVLSLGSWHLCLSNVLQIDCFLFCALPHVYYVHLIFAVAHLQYNWKIFLPDQVPFLLFFENVF